MFAFVFTVSFSSGTPVQNNLGELLALLSFLMPAIFRSDVIETLLEFLGEVERKADSSASVQVRNTKPEEVSVISWRLLWMSPSVALYTSWLGSQQQFVLMLFFF